MIHHLSCATMRPVGTFGGRLAPREVVGHCLLVERPDGLVLVDTGFGRDDVTDPRRLGRLFRAAMRPVLDRARTAAAQVEALGHRVEDVTDIVLTHLDLDHAGGLADFQHARVHVYAAELDAALHPRLRERPRYARAQWAHGPKWVAHQDVGEDWFGFGSVRALGTELLLVPLHGHTRGHCGVAVARPGGGWLLHAGDSYFDAGELEDPPHVRSGLSGYQRLLADDNEQRLENQVRLRELHATHGGEVTVFSAHDPGEFALLAGQG